MNELQGAFSFFKISNFTGTKTPPWRGFCAFTPTPATCRCGGLLKTTFRASCPASSNAFARLLAEQPRLGGDACANADAKRFRSSIPMYGIAIMRLKSKTHITLDFLPLILLLSMFHYINFYEILINSFVKPKN